MTRYLLYQITNLDNRRYYIGAHLCRNTHRHFANGVCTYMGSGVAIRAAVKKHGVHRFKKDVLAEVQSEELLYQLEAVVVDEAFAARRDTYNIAPGGKGGNGRIRLGVTLSDATKAKISTSKIGTPSPFKGIPRSAEVRATISAIRQAQPGRPQTLETRRKQSEARRRWHERRRLVGPRSSHGTYRSAQDVK